MRSDNNQTDMFRDRDPTPEEWRIAAARALENPWESPTDAQRRHDHYLAQAARAEQQLAEVCRG